MILSLSQILKISSSVLILSSCLIPTILLILMDLPTLIRTITQTLMNLPTLIMTNLPHTLMQVLGLPTIMVPISMEWLRLGRTWLWILTLRWLKVQLYPPLNCGINGRWPYPMTKPLLINHPVLKQILYRLGLVELRCWVNWNIPRIGCEPSFLGRES